MATIVISTTPPAANTSLSAANPYLSADGLIDVVAIDRLAGKIATSNKKVGDAAKAAAKSPASVKTKNATPIFYTRKPAIKYSASLEKKNDHKYKTIRGQQIKSRTRMPSIESNVKMKILLPALLEGADKSIIAEVKKAMSAIAQHNKKAIKVVDKVKVEKVKIRDAANAEFDANVEVLIDALVAGGIKESNIVVGQSMFGKTLLVKLPNGGVVSVGKSDESKLRAAKKSNSAA